MLASRVRPQNAGRCPYSFEDRLSQLPVLFAYILEALIVDIQVTDEVELKASGNI